MATPVIIDTDMTASSAVGIALALAAEAIDLRAIVGVGGGVSLNQAVANIGRFLDVLRPPAMPRIGIGLDPPTGTTIDRREIEGADGLGGWDQPTPANLAPERFEKAYESIAGASGGELVIVALGPLTNLAALLESSPAIFKSVRRMIIAGGTLRLAGNASKLAEFNFHRDPRAAARVLNSGLPITLVPLDVTHLVCLDQSHVAHLAASGYRTGEVPARLLEHALEFDGEPAYGKVFIPGAVAVGSMLWPNFFMKTRMGLQATAEGPEAGRVKAALATDKSKQVDVLTAVNAVDLLENLLESLCHEAFIV